MSQFKSVYISLVINLIFIFTVNLALAESEIKSENSELINLITEKLKTATPGLQIDQIKPAPISGFMTVISKDGEIFYISNDARYVIAGELLDITKPRMQWSLTELERSARNKKILSDINIDQVITYPAENTKTYITVLTDVDCQYCRKFHEEVPKLTQAGIEVRYLAFPRMGLNSKTGEKMTAIWCSKDSKANFELAKKGEFLDFDQVANCPDNPVPAHFDLGVKLGVNGTPAIFLADGTLIRGYIEAENLLKIINQ